jgi:hypothetical protein
MYWLLPCRIVPPSSHNTSLDLLWLHGEDLGCIPLMKRTAKLNELVANRRDHLLYCYQVEKYGEKCSCACTGNGVLSN